MITTQAFITVDGVTPYTVPDILIVDAADPVSVEETRAIVRDVVESIFERPATVRFAFESAPAGEGVPQ